ncbi:hypothetical protein OS188_09515 [Xanthomarina sp. F1114]|uniref:hypothetical protein n=1 Tax=Xanthomarina sp. F1114 TaxID=2996019 RepID=UPI00225E6722|nr:hypothetical protein [Xanthomarina sp. F1114]MCX7548191.1 hypothetical protein [Xanthomarina sp. F1114]
MKLLINKYTKFIPYLYFIAAVAYWFSSVNKIEGVTAYPILLFGIPFVWQLIKPSKQLNFSLGIIFVCLSSYMILAYLMNSLNIISFSETIQDFLILSGVFVFGNFLMSLWMIRNSMKKAF